MPLTRPIRCVIGLTGPFGSGCSTLAEVLGTLDPPFHVETLSDELKAEWSRHNKGKPKRHDLQRLGDQMRREDRAVLARRAVERANRVDESIQYLALDGIRNTGEVDYLQEEFGEHFFLFAIDAPGQERWRRVRVDYERLGLTENDFASDDRRDKDEETPEGQQVQLCVDRADVFIFNATRRTASPRQKHFRKLLTEYVELLTGEKPRYATQSETMMNLAYSAAHATKCLKRQVGAVIVTQRGEPISSGFNENPDAIKPCIEEFGECYRDRLRNAHFAELGRKDANCPECGKVFGVIVGPPWRCPHCRANLEAPFFPDRAMKWCTALHAEERAIINARGQDLTAAVLYTTAFPCFLCAEKILQAGIRDIVFSEAYPDTYSAELLQRATPEVTVTKFEGVRSGKFDRIFARVRAHYEDRVHADRLRAARPKTGPSGASASGSVRRPQQSRQASRTRSGRRAKSR